jgi:serine/threonine protein kinase
MVDLPRDSTTTAEAQDVDISALSPGARIGRYEVAAVLGKGSFGITYRARDEQLGREVAIKEYLPMALAYREAGSTVRPRSTKDAEDFIWGRDRFVAEGRTLASLQDAPGIVKVFDFLEMNGTAYIVMELIRGETLENHINRQGRMDPAAIDLILWPLLDGLEQVHAAGFLHRDIKPANIIVDYRGQARLIDFGASRSAMAGRAVAMTAVYTPGYAAAEQFSAARQGPWTDIYALSATLYRAIVGGAPPSAIDRMLEDTCEPIARRAGAGFAVGLLFGIDAGLAVRASDRPQSIAAWRPLLAGQTKDAATVVARRSIAAASAVGLKSPRSPTPSRRIGLAAGVAAIVVALAVGGGYLLFGPDRSSSTGGRAAATVRPAAAPLPPTPPTASQTGPSSASYSWTAKVVLEKGSKDDCPADDLRYIDVKNGSLVARGDNGTFTFVPMHALNSDRSGRVLTQYMGKPGDTPLPVVHEFAPGNGPRPIRRDLDNGRCIWSWVPI